MMQSMTSLLLRSYWDQQHLVSNLLVFRPAENFVRQPPKSCAAEGDECTWDNILQGYRETKTSIKRSQTRTETFTSKLCKTTVVIRNSEKINPNNPSGPSESTPRHMPRFPVSPRPRPNGLLLLEPLAPREALFAAARNFEPNLEDIAPKTNVLMVELWIHLTRFEQYLLGGATIHGGLRQGCLRRWLWIWAPRRKPTMRADGAATFLALVSQSCWYYAACLLRPTQSSTFDLCGVLVSSPCRTGMYYW